MKNIFSSMILQSMLEAARDLYTFRACFSLSSFSVAVWKVDGNIPGKNLIATGRRTSMKGTIIKTEKGISRNMSPVVLTSCKQKLNHLKTHFSKREA